MYKSKAYRNQSSLNFLFIAKKLLVWSTHLSVILYIPAYVTN